MTEHEHSIQLSDLEAWILETIDNIGWYAYLWFPVISREVLNFGCKVPEEEVYTAFVGLVRKGALVFIPEDTPEKEWTSIPQWKPAPDALAIAKDILRSKFGWPDSYHPNSK
jgi:hypothetical protein